MDKFNNYLDEIKIEETCLKFLKTELKKEYSFDLFLAPLSKVANVEKKFPLEWIVEGNKIDDRFFEYAMPLMMDRVPEYAILR